MLLFAAQLVNGLSLGSLYALFGIGFGLVFATLGVLNAAHGAYASAAALAAYFLIDRFGTPFAVAGLAGVAVGGVLAVVVDQIGFQPLRNRRSGMLAALITSIAFWIILDSLFGVATDQQSLAFPASSYPQAMLALGPLKVPTMQLVNFALLIAVATGVHLLIEATRLGAAMRAVGCNDVAAALGGVNARMIVLVKAFLAGATSGLAGVLAGIATSNVSASLGEGLLLKGFAAVVVGGFDDVRGTALAGLLLGVVEVFVAQYLSTSFRDGFTYLILLVFLVVRPRGLFGRDSVVRA